MEDVTQSPGSRAANMLREVLLSERPLIYIRTAEENRVANLLREAGRALFGSTALPVWTWTLTEGMRDPDGGIADGSESPRAALDFIAANRDAGIFHLKDFHEPLRQSPEIRRRLRDLYDECLDHRKFIVITSPVQFIPEELERSFVTFDLRPPDTIELMEFLREEARRISSSQAGADASDDNLYPLARALQGLTLDEARHAVRRALALSPTLGPQSLPALREEKALMLTSGGVIEFVPETTDITQIGGLENLKKWLQERRKLFQMRDSLNAEIVPKGVLVMGIPGCGKSLSVKVIASQFELPLYRIDMIGIFSGRHGKPEGAFAETCKTLEETAPAVAWFDEIEMGIASTESSGELGRIFAFFLTWMQEKARGLFVAATANRIDLLPAELIRKGRFDEVFFLDLPLEEERIEIFTIHLNRRGVDAARLNLARLPQFTKNWSGAEIEQCVVSALTQARLAEREVTTEDLVTTAMGMIPLSRTMKEQINHIREWAYDRAIRASRRPVGK